MTESKRKEIVDVIQESGTVVTSEADLFVRVMQLVKHGASLDFRGMKEETALHSALRFEYENIAFYLVAIGADIAATNRDGDTPLHIAAYVKLKGAVRLLIAEGANVNARTDFNTTPLIAVTQYSEPKGVCVEIAEELLAAGADIEAKNEDGQTAFYFAVKREKFQLADLLLREGADINVENLINETFLEELTRTHHPSSPPLSYLKKWRSIIKPQQSVINPKQEEQKMDGATSTAKERKMRYEDLLKAKIRFSETGDRMRGYASSENGEIEKWVAEMAEEYEHPPKIAPALAEDIRKTQMYPMYMAIEFMRERNLLGPVGFGTVNIIEESCGYASNENGEIEKWVAEMAEE